MKPILHFFLIILTCMGGVSTLAQCNRTLLFDGNGDQVSTNLVLGATDFSIEMWFKSDATSIILPCSTSYRRLLSLEKTSSPTFLLEFGECNGEMVVQENTFFNNTGSVNIRDNNWHHLALVWSAGTQTYEVLLDCAAIFSNYIPSGLEVETFAIGGRLGLPDASRDWIGGVDETRVWNAALSTADLCAGKDCPLDGTEAGLLLYWPFDQGEAGGNNTAITQVEDLSGNNHPGDITGFILNFSQSNFVCSGAFDIMPYLMRTELEINNYPDLLPVTEICNGDPVQFCLPGVLALPPLGSNVTMTWQSEDGSGTWTDITNAYFNGYCFVLPSDVITVACPGNPDGYFDIQYRAKFEVVNASPSYTCTMYSEVYPLRVCCPISDIPAADFMVMTDIHDDLLCINDVVNFTVMLQSPDIYVQTPGPEVDIKWYYNGVDIGYLDQTSFTFPAPVAVVPPEVCIQVEITNCALKSKTLEKCFTVDLTPQCGSIGSLTDPAILMPDGSDPNVFYICPGNTAELGMVDALFDDCSPNWQYSFDNLNWFSLGNSNPIQNTNILPSYYWPGWPDYTNDHIYYRICCVPIPDPSGCDPCYSNVIEIRLLDAVVADVIVGDDQVCKEDLPAILTVASPNPDYDYTWYCNGLPFPPNSNPDFNATFPACYWVEISNGCPDLEYITPWHCLEVCEVIARISCPFPPNECAELGEPITISGCSPLYSEDNCAGAHIYTWSSSSGTGTAGGAGGCEFTDTPLPTGTTYTLTVTNTTTGCSDTASLTIIPCDAN